VTMARPTLPYVADPTPKEYRGAQPMGAPGVQQPSITVQSDPAHAVVTDDQNLNGDTRARVQVVLRDIPLIAIQNTWQLPDLPARWFAHGRIFESSAQMADSILGDDRVQATLGSRIGGLFGSEIRFKAANDSAAAKEVLECVAGGLATNREIGPLVELSAYTILMGFSECQCRGTPLASLDTHAAPVAPAILVLQLGNQAGTSGFSQDGAVTISRAMGTWLLHTPSSAYRGWIRGAIRALASHGSLTFLNSRLGQVYRNTRNTFS